MAPVTPFLHRNLHPIKPSPYAGSAIPNHSPTNSAGSVTPTNITSGSAGIVSPSIVVPGSAGTSSATQVASTGSISPTNVVSASSTSPTSIASPSTSIPSPLVDPTVRNRLQSLCNEMDPNLFRSSAIGLVSELRGMKDVYSKHSRLPVEIEHLFKALDCVLDEMALEETVDRRGRQMQLVARRIRRVCHHLSSTDRPSTSSMRTRSVLEGTPILSSQATKVAEHIVNPLIPKMTLVRTDLNIPRPTGPHSFRNSAFCYPRDTVKSNTDDIIMPPPTGPEVEYTLDHNGQVQSASYAGLICLLTRRQITQDPDLQDLFMRFFRSFNSPSSFLLALIMRYKSPTAPNLDPKQRRVWEDQNIPLIRFRVGQIMVTWLTKYWRDEDDEVLQEMRLFVRTTFQPNPQLYKELIKQIDEKTMCYKDLPHIPLRSFDSSSSLTMCAGTLLDFNIPPLLEADEDEETDDVDTQTLVLRARGRVLSVLCHLSEHIDHRAVFSQHLTTIFAHKYHTLDHLHLAQLFRLTRPPPSNLLVFTPSVYRKGGRVDFAYGAFGMPDGMRLVRTRAEYGYLVGTVKAVQEIYDLALCLTLCVVHSVVDPQKHKDRTKRIMFWINIASRLIDLRNYPASRAIIDGLTHPAVTRLLLTIAYLPSLDVEVLFGLCRRLGLGSLIYTLPYNASRAPNLRLQKPPSIGIGMVKECEYKIYRTEIKGLWEEDGKAQNQAIADRVELVPKLTLPLLRVLNDDVYTAARRSPDQNANIDISTGWHKDNNNFFTSAKPSLDPNDKETEKSKDKDCKDKGKGKANDDNRDKGSKDKGVGKEKGKDTDTGTDKSKGKDRCKVQASQVPSSSSKTQPTVPRPNCQMIDLHPYRTMRDGILVLEKCSIKSPPPELIGFPLWFQEKLEGLYWDEDGNPDQLGTNFILSNKHKLRLQCWLLAESQGRERHEGLN